MQCIFYPRCVNARVNVFSTHQDVQLTGFRVVDDPARSYSLLKVLMSELALTAGEKKKMRRGSKEVLRKDRERRGFKEEFCEQK